MQQVIERDGIKIELADCLSSRMKAVLESGEYERDELSIVKRTLIGSDKVMEIGTGIGLISSFCAKKIGSERVFTYEANAELLEQIRRTFALNNVEPCLEICLLAHSEGDEEFNVAEDFWASSTRDLGTSATKTVSVSKRLFEKELERIQPSYLILDIEGGEFDLLLGSNLRFVNKILLEMHTFFIGVAKANEIIDHLSNCGFEINRKVTYAQSPQFSFKRRIYEYLRHVCRNNQTLEKSIRGFEKMSPNYTDAFHGNVFFERVRTPV